MHIDSVAIRFVIFPVSFVNVAIRVPEFTLAISFILAPLALVTRTIGPQLGTRAVSGALKQIALVDGTILKSELLDELQILSDRLEFEVAQKLIRAEVMFLFLLTGGLHRGRRMLLNC